MLLGTCNNEAKELENAVSVDSKFLQKVNEVSLGNGNGSKGPATMSCYLRHASKYRTKAGCREASTRVVLIGVVRWFGLVVGWKRKLRWQPTISWDK